MSLIGLESGARAFCDELECASPTDAITAVEVVYGGPEEGGSVLPVDPNRRTHRVERGRDRYLDDHRIGGKAVVPVAMVVEWFTRAASEAFPKLHLVAMSDFAVLKGVVVEDAGAELSVRWSGTPDALAFTLVGSNGVVHYRATLAMAAEKASVARFPGSNGLGKERYPYAIADAYKRFLFHGPTLHGIDEVVGMSDHGMVARISSSSPERFGERRAAWATDPLVVDSALQMMLLWVREKHGTAALPCAIGEFAQHAPFDGPVTVHLEMTKSSAAAGRFDATFVDGAGRVVARLAGGEYAASAALAPSFRAEAK